MGCQLCGIDRDKADRTFKEVKSLKRQAVKEATRTKELEDVVQVHEQWSQVHIRERDDALATVKRLTAELVEARTGWEADRKKLAAQTTAARCDENASLRTQVKNLTELNAMIMDNNAKIAEQSQFFEQRAGHHIDKRREALARAGKAEMELLQLGFKFRDIGLLLKSERKNRTAEFEEVVDRLHKQAKAFGQLQHSLACVAADRCTVPGSTPRDKREWLLFRPDSLSDWVACGCTDGEFLHESLTNEYCGFRPSPQTATQKEIERLERRNRELHAMVEAHEKGRLAAETARNAAELVKTEATAAVHSLTSDINRLRTLKGIPDGYVFHTVSPVLSLLMKHPSEVCFSGEVKKDSVDIRLRVTHKPGH